MAVRNILIFTSGYTGEKLLENLKKLKLTPFIATSSSSEIRKNHTGNMLAYKNDFQIFEVSYNHYDFSKNMLPQVDIILCVDWKKDYFSGSIVNSPIYYMHPSLLPKYRGYGAISEQFLRGVVYSGMSIYEYNGIIDGGDILYQKEIKIEDYFFAADFIDEVAKETALFIKELYAGNNFQKIKQNNSLAFYLPKTRKSSKVIDFNISAPSLYNFIRAYSYPFSMASFYFKGQEYKIVSASIESWSGIEGKCGEIIKQIEYGIVVACGSGSILIKEVEHQGKTIKAVLIDAYEGDILL